MSTITEKQRAAWEKEFDEKGYITFMGVRFFLGEDGQDDTIRFYAHPGDWEQAIQDGRVSREGTMIFKITDVTL